MPWSYHSTQMKEQEPANGFTLFQGPMLTSLGDVDAVSAGISQKLQAMKCLHTKEIDCFNGNSYSFGTMTNMEHQEKG